MLSLDPFDRFDRLFARAREAGEPDASAHVLATASAGQPSARCLLLKGVDGGGFVFFTNYRSRKGSDLEANPRAALCFWWRELHRQLRVEGTVERIGADESDAYFQARPRLSQLSAIASPQSQAIGSRDELEERVAALDRLYAGAEPPRPETWGGYRVVPEVVELWQGRSHRLHDRLRYTSSPAGGWAVDRLAP